MSNMKDSPKRRNQLQHGPDSLKKDTVYMLKNILNTQPKKLLSQLTMIGKIFHKKKKLNFKNNTKMKKLSTKPNKITHKELNNTSKELKNTMNNSMNRSKKL